jgi:hypothetical protein
MQKSLRGWWNKITQCRPHPKNPSPKEMELFKPLENSSAVFNMTPIIQKIFCPHLGRGARGEA